ncbi:hypothetical protein CU669_11015 [Paramagnetospirillum kuznetsovii]|uniref:Chitooligosaccharide deacetylase n=2 Tax=Paramagnetospirillum kuznetsovii TaxID=2053833 RepID=A0A364NXJ9_9PROT|nr:hypothetical protein CU669_11015 [Paramagnetospirillum kuznetsovii]
MTWQAYGALARAQGFDRLYLLLSFDCDRHEDAEVVEMVDGWLVERGIPRTYAVPGVMLTEAAEIYRKLASKGARFINHGGRAHVEFRDGRYWSCTFYDRFSEAEVAQDIAAGHEAVIAVTGQIPTGFRAPHFGLLDNSQREYIYNTLRAMGYRFSSSSLPELGLAKGPLVDVGGLVELPCSGSWVAPHIILDSWSHVRSPVDPVVTAAYGNIMMETCAELFKHRQVGVLNWYADPSHVAQGDVFRRCLDAIGDHGIKAIGFEDLLVMGGRV